MNIRSAIITSWVAFGSLLIASAPASASPVLTVSPTTVTVSGTAGKAVSSKTVSVSNTGTGVLKWSVATPTAAWLRVSPTSGSDAGTLTVSFPTTFAAGSYSASFVVVSASGQSRTVTVKLSISAAALTVTCPANYTTSSSNGSAVAVSYTVSTSGGVAPITVVGTPASGSLFPVGTTSVSVTATSSDGQKATCGFSVTVTYTGGTTTSGYGPQSTITCPAGAMDIWPATNIQNLVNLYGTGTTFCLRAGTHSLTSAITPKSGDTFVGEYGAILDGTGWSTTDTTQGAFRAQNQDIDDVTIRNLVIRNMPQCGIHAYYMYSDRWTIEYNEIFNTKVGVAAPNSSLVRNNYIHNNANGGYNGYRISGTTFDTNEIAYNGAGQKVLYTSGVTFRNNFIHHNTDGIFYDTENTSALIEGNRIEDNTRNGIFYEVSATAVIRNNTVRRSGDTAIFISTSKSVQTYGNLLEYNFRGIQYFLNCAAVGGGTLSFDLADDTSHDNTIKVNTTSGAFANGFNYLSTCTSAQYGPYYNRQKNLTFQNNHYYVPYSTVKYWVWGLGGLMYWPSWQPLPQDSTGTMQIQ